MRLDGRQRRGHALARKDNDQVRVIGRRTVERPCIIHEPDIARLHAHAPTGAVGPTRAFELEIDEQLVGTARDQRRLRIRIARDV
jgi:hypothetical protein